ncbi:MAG: hypothetical protein QXW00_01795 [Candidatus Woesearchaeota archaeon]
MAQVWSIDFMVGLLIFTFAVILYFMYSGDIFSYDELDSEGLRIEASSIASALLTPGYPQDWNSSNVIRLGISEDGSRINVDKLNAFSEVASNYSRMKSLFHVRNDFQILITENSSIVFFAGINKTSKLVSVSNRIVILNDSLCKLEVRTFGG